MRTVIFLLVATLVMMLAGALSTQADEVAAPDAPLGSTLPADEPDVEAIIEQESEVLEDDPDMQRSGWEARYFDEVAGKVDLDHLWRDPPQTASMLYRLTVAVLRSRTVPAGKDKPREVVWQRCGVEVPKEEVIYRAAEWAGLFLASQDRVERETGYPLNTWGMFASHANEGGFDECALDFATRRWASTHEAKRLTEETWEGRTVRRKISRKLVDKFRLSYDRETVWTILHDSYYPTAKVELPNGKKLVLAGKSDLGPWQFRTSVKKLTRENFDQITSMVPGIYIGVREMARRAQSFSYRYRVKEPHPRPWVFWPGWNPYAPRNMAYDNKVTTVARWLGARKDEIELGFVIVDTSKKKRKYKVERILGGNRS